jgi:hypothetical protein
MVSVFYLPHPWVGQCMGLKPNLLTPGELLDARTGEIVFMDPGRGTPGVALVNEEKFFEFLRQEGLECVWIVADERSSYPSGERGDFARRYFSSVYRRDGDSWTGSRWHEDQTRRDMD